LGANTDEYKRSKNSSRFGEAYQRRLGSLAIPGAIAPMAGMMGGTALENAGTNSDGVVTDQSMVDYGEILGTTGSALGAMAAPLMFRGATKSAINNNADMRKRTDNLNSGKRMTASQRADTALNAGASVKNASMGALGLGYGANAISSATGNGNIMDSNMMMALMKGGNVGSLGGATNAGIAASNDQNVFAGLTGGEYDIGKAMGMGADGAGLGMAMMLAMSMAGSKATKGIKNLANGDKKNSSKYTINSLTQANPDRSLAKYRLPGSFDAQSRLLAMTDKLSPFENLALTALSAIANNTGASPALYNFLTGKEDTNNSNLKFAHNKISGVFEDDTEFSSSASSTIGNRNESRTSKLLKGYRNLMGDMDDAILSFAKGTTAGATALNPLNILFGGIFGDSAEKQISELYGLDEDSIRGTAIERTAKNLNLPTAMVQMAETRADKILMMAGDNPDAKKIAMLQMIAEVNRNQLILMLEDKAKSEGSSFIGKTEQNFQDLNVNEGVEGILKKVRGIAGNIPGLGLIASLFAMQEARQKIKEDRDQLFLDTLEFDPNSVTDRNTHQALMNSFMGTEFPSLFLESLDLDIERNILLTELRDEILKANGSKPSSREASISDRTWDMVSGTISTNQQAIKSQQEDYKENLKLIEEHYQEVLERDPKRKGEIQEAFKQSKKDLKNRKEYSGMNEMSIQNSQDKDKEQKVQTTFVETLNSIKKSFDKKNEKETNGIAGLSGDKVGLMKILKAFMDKGTLSDNDNSKYLRGNALRKGSLILRSIGSLFVWAWNNKLKMVLPVMGAAYLGYLAYTNSDTIKNMVNGTTKFATDILGSWENIQKLALVGGTAYTGYKIFNFIKSPTGKLVGETLASVFTATKNVKLKAAIGVGLLGVLGWSKISQYFTGDDSILSKIMGSSGLSKLLGQKNDAKLDTLDTVAIALDSIGAGLLMAPSPHAKLAGIAFLAAGGIAGKWDDIKAGMDKGRGMLWDLLGSYASTILPDEWEQYSSKKEGSLRNKDEVALEKKNVERRQWNQDRILDGKFKKQLKETGSNLYAGGSNNEAYNNLLKKVAGDDNKISKDEAKDSKLIEVLDQMKTDAIQARMERVKDGTVTDESLAEFKELMFGLQKTLHSLGTVMHEGNKNIQLNVIQSVDGDDIKYKIKNQI